MVRGINKIEAYQQHGVLYTGNGQKTDGMCFDNFVNVP